MSYSCYQQDFVEGRVELVSRQSVQLNDSSLFVGQVNLIGWPGLYFIPVEVWIEDTDFKTISDSLGQYSLKTLPGTYTIKAQRTINNHPRLIEE